MTDPTTEPTAEGEPLVCGVPLSNWICDETGDNCHELQLEVTVYNEGSDDEQRLGPYAAVKRECHGMLDAECWTGSPQRMAQDSAKGVYNLVQCSPTTNDEHVLIGFTVIEYRIGVDPKTGTSGLREFRRSEVLLMDPDDEVELSEDQG